jgi:tyrosyl-tRNA synthetase
LDITSRLRLITRAPTEETIKESDLKTLLSTKSQPIAYNGFEPSGLAHLGTGVITALKAKDLTDAGCKFILFLADWHAWVNGKGSWDLILRRAEYLKHVWLSLGVDPSKTQFLLGSQEYGKNPNDYWSRVIKVAEAMSLSEAQDSLTIAGQKDYRKQPFSRFLYTPMQVADIFYLGVDICQLGMDQRRANILAREKGPRLTLENGWNSVGLGGKPVCVHHHLLMGLQGPGRMGYEVDQKLDQEISSKQAKSRPQTCIFVHESLDQIEAKMKRAYFEPRNPENAVLEICRYILMRGDESPMTVTTRKEGQIEFGTYTDLEKAVSEGRVHPSDLKESVSDALYKFLEPSRRYFSANREAKELLKERVREEIDEWRRNFVSSSPSSRTMTNQGLEEIIAALPRLED